MSESNRRAHDRRAVLVEVQIALMDAFGKIEPAIAGQITDISQGGLALCTRPPMKVGSHLAVRAATKDGHIVYGVEVRSLRYEPGVGHLAGCSWLPKGGRLPQPEDFQMAVFT